MSAYFLLIRNNGEIIKIKYLSSQRDDSVPHIVSDKGFKETFVIRALSSLHVGSFKQEFSY